MRTRSADLLRIGIVLLALGAGVVGWRESSSAGARTLAVILSLATGTALIAGGVFRMVVRHRPFSTTYPIFLVGIGVLLQLAGLRSPIKWVHDIAGLVITAGLVLYLRIVLKTRATSTQG